MDELRLTSRFRHAFGVVLLCWSLVVLVAAVGNLAAARELPLLLRGLLLAGALFLGAYTLRTLARLRDAAATAAGLRISRLGGRTEVEVPWARVRRMRLQVGPKGSRWLVEYDPPGAAGAHAHVPAPHPLGGNPPAPVERVRTLWEAAAGPVSLTAGYRTWELRPGGE